MTRDKRKTFFFWLKMRTSYCTTYIDTLVISLEVLPLTHAACPHRALCRLTEHRRMQTGVCKKTVFEKNEGEGGRVLRTGRAVGARWWLGDTSHVLHCSFSFARRRCSSDFFLFISAVWCARLYLYTYAQDILLATSPTALRTLHFFNNMSGDLGAKALAQVRNDPPIDRRTPSPCSLG